MAARDDEPVKGGPANHAAETDLDAPTPPGGPLRQDRPDADVFPNAAVDPSPPQPDPDVRPSSSPHEPTTIPASPPPDEPADRHPLQEENAESSLDQPSDGSGGE